MSNKIYGFLNNICNEGFSKEQEIFNQRINYAFANNGIGFWSRFFLCHSQHKYEEYVYLFSEEQFILLYEWWKEHVVNVNNDTATEEEKEIKENLRQSLEHFITSYTSKKRLHEEGFYLGFFSRVNLRKYILTKIVFEEKFKKDGRLYFFSEDITKFLSCTKDYSDDLGKTKRFFGLLLGTLRENVNKKIFCNKHSIGDYNWLYYNGRNDMGDKPFLYCINANEENKKNCPYPFNK